MAADEDFTESPFDSDDETDTDDSDDLELSDLDELEDLDEDYDVEEEEEEGAEEDEKEQVEADEAEDESAEEAVEEDDEEAEESLDVLLAREKVIAEDELGQLDDEPKEALTAPTSPIGAGEFTCRSCFLVKRRAQLADEELQLCLDCA